MTWPGLTQDVEARLMIFHLLVILNEKEGANTQEILAGPTKKEKLTLSLWDRFDVDLFGTISFTVRTPSKINSLLTLIMIDLAIQHRFS
jgi:hypothetical protein